MRLVSSKSLFLTTEHRNEGTSYAPVFQLPIGAMERADGQLLRLTLIRWSCFVGWPNVNGTNDTFIFRNNNTYVETTITLEQGNFQYKTLAKYITEAYAGVTVTYDTVANCLVFQFAAPHTLMFVNDSYKVLGFVNDGQLDTDPSNRITGGMLKGRAVDRVLIAARGVTPQALSLIHI
jgi:hypothetical protein